MRPLTVTDVARRPLPGSVVPVAPAFSPDGSSLLYLMAEHGSLTQHLIAVDVPSGRARVVPTPGTEIDETTLSLEERLRRERARQLAVGVTRFSRAARADAVLVPMADGLWFLEDPDAEPRLLVAAADVDGAIVDPQLSDDGTLVGFVLDDEVWVVATAAGDSRPITAGAAAAGVTHGVAEFIAQEEMGRGRGFWFSHDGSQVAFCAVDERAIPRYRIMHLGADTVGPGAEEDHAYPFAGADNAAVSVGVVTADGSTADRPVWLDLSCTGIGDDRYVARVDWSPDGEVWVQVQNRAQSRLDLIAFDPATGTGRLVHTERSDIWINLHDMLRFLPGNEFLWASERTGFRHLEVRSARDGSLVRQLTGGDWVVTTLVGVDDTTAWFIGTTDAALERHLFTVPVDGSASPTQVTAAAGVHTVAAHPATATYVDIHSSPHRPPVTTLITGTTSTVLADTADDADPLALAPPEERTVTAADGTALHAAVFRPAGSGPHPLIVWVYGGPHAQLVTRSWSTTVAMRAQFLRQEGFCVAVCDGRGSTDRGLAFEGHLRHRMGTVEVDDQVALVESLVADGLADPDRVGIYGWSYGGYMSAMCLARRPDIFSAACAGAPVTAWDGYDTHYTERYMSTPADNPDGYEAGSVMTHAGGIPDRSLLLIHGLIDENVHFRHTARLAGALNRAGIAYDLLMYPDERHLPRAEPDRVSMERRILDFFTDRLNGRRSR